MYALVARRDNYDEGYWDFWLFDSAEKAEADWALQNDEQYGWSHKVVDLNESSPEADFVNGQVQAQEAQKTS